MWIILFFVLIGLVLPIVTMLIDGYLRGKRADVLRVAVEQKLVAIDDLKTMLFEERRGDPLGNYKAGLVLLSIGLVFVIWGFGELVAIKMHPQLMKLPGLRVGIAQSPGSIMGNDKFKESKFDPKKDRISEYTKDTLNDTTNPSIPKHSEEDMKILEDQVEEGKIIPNPEETKEEFKNRILERIRNRRLNSQPEDNIGEKEIRGLPKQPNGFNSEKPDQIWGQRRITGNKKRMVIIETPGLPLIALTKLFIGALSLTISFILLLIHRKYSKLVLNSK